MQMELDQEKPTLGVDGDMSVILPNSLYLGSYEAAKDINFLKENGITHILNCAKSICPVVGEDQFTVVAIDFKDAPSENIECLFYPCFSFIESCLSQKGKILVHCQQGISRSAAIVIAYMMWKEKKNFDEIYNKVKGLRKNVNPNMGFIFQLNTFSDRLFKKEEKLQIHSICSFNRDRPGLIVSQLLFTSLVLPKPGANESAPNLPELFVDFAAGKLEGNYMAYMGKYKSKIGEQKEVHCDKRGLFIIANNQKAFIVSGSSLKGRQAEEYKKIAEFYLKFYNESEGLSKEVTLIEEATAAEKCKDMLTPFKVELKFDTYPKFAFKYTNLGNDITVETTLIAGGMNNKKFQNLLEEKKDLSSSQKECTPKHFGNVGLGQSGLSQTPVSQSCTLGVNKKSFFEYPNEQPKSTYSYHDLTAFNAVAVLELKNGKKCTYIYVGSGVKPNDSEKIKQFVAKVENKFFGIDDIQRNAGMKVPQIQFSQTNLEEFKKLFN